MKKPVIAVNPASFPNQLATDAEKASLEYGLNIGQSIQYQWFKRSGNTCRFYNQWVDFHKLRLYARGEQSTAKYKSELAVDGDLSYLNLDWTPVPIIPKFVDIVVNGMSDRLFTVQAYAQDAMASDQRKGYQQMIEADMVAKDFLLQTEEQFGINAFNTQAAELPANDQELALHMQLNYKPAIEIAEEEAINTVLQENNFIDLRKRVDYDIAVIGCGWMKHEFLPTAGISISYVDPANLIYSYTESPYFDDCFYFGEVKRVGITELLKINPSLTKEELQEISQLGSSWTDQYSITQPYTDDLFQKDVVTLLYFNYKTDKKFVYKKKYMDSGGERVIRKDEEFNPPAEMMEEKFERIEKRIDVWYEGVMVMGSEYLLKWELSKNMVRPKSASQYAIGNYIGVAPRMYKGVIESLTRRMIPFADLIQMTHLKLQQVLSRVVPDGVYIDADGLNEVDLGTGAAYNPEDALKLYFQTGSVIGRSFTQDGEYNHAKIPIQELNTSSGQSKMASLIHTYNHYLGMIRDVTGLNEARDGSTPDPNALVGVQKLAALNSNTATRHILDGSLFITKRLAEALSCRISDVLEYADFREEFINQIGKYNVGILEDISGLYLHDFGIFIEISPDEEQKAQLEANIQIALSRDGISLEDAIDIRQVRNLKMANELLKVKRRAKRQADITRENEKMQMQSQIQMQSQQAAAQAAMQKVQQETQSKIEIKQAEAAFDIEKLNAEAALKRDLMGVEFQMQMSLKGAEAGQLKTRENEREQGKSDRISQQNSQQSTLIQQRKDNLPPTDFESQEDSLDGFDLSQFNPR
tara:strand:- start:4041 stop:6473 length:2433 start_codon:yes stop_codon:yes gene_type:complete